MSTLAFDFGRNWEAFSDAKLDDQRLDDAVRSLQQLIGPEKIEGKTFLDIGCGSGLFSIAAALCGARQVIGIDINPTAIEVSRHNLQRFQSRLERANAPEFFVGNVLDDAFLADLSAFEIVYSWGVLHHTGAMWDAIHNAASLVEPQNGTFVIAIYKHHWSSPVWKQIKRLYNLSPDPIRTVSNYVFGALIFVAIWTATRSNPLNKPRGMDFWYDVIDWLGGYPYEYAGDHEIVQFVQPLGFRVEKIVSDRAPTGCNEFVFKRISIS